jgi:hypothetical protein
VIPQKGTAAHRQIRVPPPAKPDPVLLRSGIRVQFSTGAFLSTMRGL